jgi:hypothetical protein
MIELTVQNAKLRALRLHHICSVRWLTAGFFNSARALLFRAMSECEPLHGLGFGDTRAKAETSFNPDR